MLFPTTLALSAAAVALLADAPPVTSTFDANAEGWVIRDLNCNNYNQVVGGGVITWIPSGGAGGSGESNGFIRSTDPSSNCYTYEAPAAYTGNRSEYLGGTFCWSIRTNVMDWPQGSVLILRGGGVTLVAPLTPPVTGTWVRYCVPLTPASFRVNTASGATATPIQLATVLGSLDIVRISAEFGSEQGEETVDLDAVILRGPCTADLNGDGDVNGADLGLLLAAWGSSDPTADLNGDGDVNGADLGLLLAAWGAC